MKYYMILLWCGKVVEICSYDEEAVRDEHVRQYTERAEYSGDFNEVQQLNTL